MQNRYFLRVIQDPSSIFDKIDFYDSDTHTHLTFSIYLSWRSREEFIRHVAERIYEYTKDYDVVNQLINQCFTYQVKYKEPEKKLDLYPLFIFILNIPTIPMEVLEWLRIMENNMYRQTQVKNLMEQAEEEKLEYYKRHGTLLEKTQAYLSTKL